jgi:hypothetical protein
MKKRTKRLLGSVAVAAGALTAIGKYLKRKKNLAPKQRLSTRNPGDVWARPGMMVTFRAELMPGRDKSERTFKVKQLLSSGRVILHGVEGEHAEREFQPIP